jgi:hypothetical protein
MDQNVISGGSRGGSSRCSGKIEEGVAKKKHWRKASAMSAGSAEGPFAVRMGGIQDRT